MSSREFDTALQEAGSDASGARLCKLISNSNFKGKGLPETAEKYLRAFCDTGSSAPQRRWIGLALASMMHASDSVVDHLRELSQDLHGLGHVLLKKGEADELKIMAGIIMRAGMAKGIDPADFWSSNKVKNSLPPFPEESDPHWTSNFQLFLDALHDLKLADTSTDASIVHPIAMVDSDGFRWGGHADLAVGVLQGTQLTVIVPDFTLGKYQFLDVPLGHIVSADVKQSEPHDSQSESKKTRPQVYELKLSLQSESWTYHLDASEHTATDLTITFTDLDELTDWEDAIRVYQHEECVEAYSGESSKAEAGHPSIGSTHVKGVAAGSSQPQKHRSSHCSEPIDVSRPRSARRTPQVDNESSEELEEDGETLVEDSFPLANTTQLQQQLSSIEPTQPFPTNAGKNDSSESDLGDEDTNSETRDEQPISKPTTTENRKGKLPKVSRAMKANVIHPRQAKSQDFDIPVEQATRNGTRKTNAASSTASSDASDSESPQQKSQAKSKAGTRASVNSKAKKTQTRRKAGDDDDEFVPGQPSPKAKRGDKRKRGADVAADNNQPKKKTRAGPASTHVPSSAARPKNRKAEAQRNEEPEPALPQKETMTKEAKQMPVEAHAALMAPPNSLIGGLVRSQKPLKASTITLEMTSQSGWADHTPSTPTKQPRSRSGARNLFESRRFPEQSPAPNASSPMVGSSARNRSLTRQGYADTELLSSNTKRGPASPHAESTAISGHADRDRVDMEKQIADNETARNDPFKRRPEKPKAATTFLRRLTSEHSGLNEVDLQEEDSGILPVDMDYEDTHEDEVLPAAVTPLISRQQPALTNKRQAPAVEQPRTSQPPARTAKPTFFAGVQKPSKAQPRVVSEKALRSLDDEPPVKPPSKLLDECQSHHVRSDEYAPGQKLAAARDSANPVARLHKERPSVRDNVAISATPKRKPQPAQPEPQHEFERDVYAEGDTTLVNDEGNVHSPADHTLSGLQFFSSPPVPGSTGSHSSTSAEVEFEPEPSPPTSQAEAAEWEASLRPYQRPLHELLMRVSNKVLQHVYDNETAVSDIAEQFARDGEHLLNSMLGRHDAEYENAFKDLEDKKKRLRKELEAATRTLVKERERVHATL